MKSQAYLFISKTSFFFDVAFRFESGLPASLKYSLSKHSTFLLTAASRSLNLIKSSSVR